MLITMPTALKTETGYYLPNAGERAVYFKDADITVVFASERFRAGPFEDDENCEILSPT